MFHAVFCVHMCITCEHMAKRIMDMIIIKWTTLIIIMEIHLLAYHRHSSKEENGHYYDINSALCTFLVVGSNNKVCPHLA